MIYVTEIESNVKGGVRCTLQQRTLLVGGNGTGKSAAINAVELALTGRVSDISGRAELSREVDLMSLAPGRSGELFAVAQLSNGEHCSFGIEGTTARARKAAHSMPASICNVAALPLRAVREAVLGSADTARKFFVQQVGGFSGADVLKRLPTLLHEKFHTLVEGERDALVGLLGALEKAGARKRDASARAKAAEEVVTQGTAGLPVEPTEADVEIAGRRLGELRAALETAIRRAVEVPQAAALVAPVGAEFGAAEVVLRASLTQTQGAFCVACGAPAPVGILFARHATLCAALAPAAPAASTIGLVADGEVLALEGLRSEIAVADSNYYTLRQQQAMWAAFRTARDQATACSYEAADWDKLGKALKKVVGDLLDVSVVQFEARVQRYLPPGDVFRLRLRDGVRETLQFGLADGESLRTALSGSEWARVTAALAAACAEGAELAILIPEDRAWDPHTLADVMEALGRFEGQVILATTTMPGRTVANWHLVLTEKGEHRGVMATAVVSG